MQPTTNLFPAVQTRQGNQVQHSNASSVNMSSQSYVRQVNHIGQQVLSMPTSLPPSNYSFPTVVRTSPQPNFPYTQSSFPGAQQGRQPTRYNAQEIRPQILNQDPKQKPLFPVSKDRT